MFQVIIAENFSKLMTDLGSSENTSGINTKKSTPKLVIFK